ncbi:MAG: hypothetical protein RR147_04925 [Oscillospiraceae bacterium]
MKKPGSERIGARRNRGSAIITVVVAMLFVVAIGTSLLFAAYTGYRVTLTERGDKKNFYSAAAAMDEIRAGLQTAVSDAIDEAYTKTLAGYANKSADAGEFETQAQFANNFYTSFAKTSFSDSMKRYTLFDAREPDYEIKAYIPNALEFLAAPPTSGGKLEVTAENGAPLGTVIPYSKDGKVWDSITLKDINVKYTQNGYESNVSSDITVTIPDFFVKPVFSTGLNSYAIVANNSLLRASGGAVNVSGDVYAGAVSLTNFAEMNFSNGNLLCKGGTGTADGTISVKDGSTFNFDAPEKELWARNIKLGASGSVGNAKLNGKLHVANDIILDGNNITAAGKGSSAVLQGSYFGFGSDPQNSNKSSAIIANGRSTSIDISKLNALYLAGVSFIDVVGVQEAANAPSINSQIPMGESLTALSNQLAYLVPAECIQNYPSNPCMFNAGSEVKEPIVNPSVGIWEDKKTGETKRLTDYIGGGKGSYKALYKNMGADTDPKLAYVFLIFNKQEYANEYFRDYFTAHPEKIEGYLKLYAEISDKKNDADINTKGNVFYTDTKGTSEAGDDRLTLFPANGKTWAGEMQARFDNMKSPFEAFVKTTELNALSKSTSLEFKQDDKVVAVVTGGNYNYNSADKIRLIISAGDTTVSKPFSGIILSGHDIIANADITAEPLNTQLLSATCTKGGKTYKLSDFIGNELSAGAASGGDTTTWDLNGLVTYKNWSKH